MSEVWVELGGVIVGFLVLLWGIVSRYASIRKEERKEFAQWRETVDKMITLTKNDIKHLKGRMSELVSSVRELDSSIKDVSERIATLEKSMDDLSKNI